MILVDAHNLLHQDPRLGRLVRRDVEAARRELERTLGARDDVILFYDGGPGGVAEARRRAGVRVDFSGGGEADDRILAWLRANAGRHVVISDDRGLAARARALGAAVAPTRGFLAHAAPAAAPDKPEPTADEVAFWLAIFEGRGDRP